MPILVVPSSNSEDNAPRLHEFNRCHEPGGRQTGGQFCSDKGTTPAVVAGAYTRPTPIRVRSVEEAVSLILKGKVVELGNTREVATVLTKLAAIALDARAKGSKAPSYDLCQVTVPGTNLFCGSKLRSEEFPNGVPRIAMPQLSGRPVPGSPASKLARLKDDALHVNGADQFVAYLKSAGIKTDKASVPAANLKASQAELIGPKIAAMMTDRYFNPGRESIFVSRDNYVVDGHHRWASVVGRDAFDGILGNLPMNVIRIDAPIAEVLHMAKTWSKKFGIKQEAGVSN